MRIVLVIHALYGGGAERLMSRLARRWSRDHEVHLITWATADTDQYRTPPRVTRHGLGLLFPSRNLLHGLWANWRRVNRLRGLLIRLEPDLVISFTDQVNIVTLQASRRLSFPVWVAEHSDPRKQRLSNAWEWWRERTYRHATGCVVLTQEVAKYAERWLPPERIRVIPAAVDDVPPGVRQAIDNQCRQFLYVGRLSTEKGVDRLLEAWGQIADQLPDWKLTIVGDGSERSRLERQAAEVPRVEFCGWLSEPEKVYRQGGIFVLPSRYEGFPVALLEAMQYGLPCIATACTSALDELNVGGQAVEVVPQDVDELGRRMLKVASDLERRAILADRGAAAAARYQWSRIGPMWDQLLER